jgi:deazaflavin-dependent oxidoreductase (nitroreductase family)
MLEGEPVAKEPYLYLTTTGRRTGLPREIEIWFVATEGRFYVFAERFGRAQWVKNIGHDAHVRVRVGSRTFAATARALNEERDSETWQLTQRLAEQKYGWGAGLPVEITPDALV